MGLVHTTSIELGRYRSLARFCPDASSFKGKRCLYIDFDGKEFGLANKLLFGGAITTVHTRSEYIESSHRSKLKGRNSVEFHVHPRLDEGVFPSPDFDVVVWWKGPESDDDFAFIEDCKHLMKCLVILGCSEDAISRDELGGFELTKFQDYGLAFARLNLAVTNPPKPKTRKRTKPKKKVVAPVVEDVVAEPEPEPVNLSGRSVTTGEMKTEQSLVLTNIKSGSTTQEVAKPKKKRAKRKTTPKAPEKSPEPMTVDQFLSEASESAKMEAAFILSGSLPSTLAEAEGVIRGADPEVLAVVI